MASTSSSSIEKSSFKYDVFLSFRGEDTRKNFVDHLYHALHHKSILTYKDDERITKGKRISDELIASIQDSRFYIIVFSKNYASSSWCLDELVNIMEECHKTTIHTAYPVFYDVEPTEVRKQIGSVGEAFSKHEKQDAAAAAKWREALKEAADLAGWELKNMLDGHEAKFIKKIVEEISLELRSIDSSVDGKLIGMESRVKEVVSALQIGSGDVRMIGIKGMGGAGKTTLARAVFDHISVQFEGKSFVENVREVSKASLSGLKELQKQVLSDVLNDQGIKVSGVHDGKNMMKKMMCGRKVLIVLDDVDNIEQLEALAGEPNWFNPGSRIIITTRDEQVLVAHRVNLIRDVNLLSDDESVCLFSRYAFGKEIPIQGYEELSGNVVSYADGLPLTIRVLGSFLCGKNELEWKDAIDRLKTIPLRETLEKLELSYIGLEEDYKEIFLDVACILKGWYKDEAVEVLESCRFHARNGLRVLEQKSLITISEDGYLGMHDHIEEMGKNIVRRLHPNEPNRHSRLWIQEEIEDILTNDLGTEATRCIQRIMSRNYRLETFIKALGNMKKLRVLVMFGLKDGINAREVPGQCLPNALRYLRWYNYPFESLMKSFEEDHLVGLSLRSSKLEQLWKCGERKVLKKLRFLALTWSSCMRTLDLEMIPNIETLNLGGCSHLVELNMPFECSKLKALDLDYTMLRTLNLGSTPDLERLSLAGCHDLLELHMPCPKLKALSLNCSKLRTLEFGPILNLEMLSIQGCDLLELCVPNECPKLKWLSVDSSKLRTLNLGSSLDLETLSLARCFDLLELHMPFQCPKLKCLSLDFSKLRTLNLGSSLDLETLSLEGCHDLLELHMPFRCPKLKALSLNCSKLRTLEFGQTDLETLSLGKCPNLIELNMPFGCPKLKSLSLSDSKLRTLDLGLTPNLERLDVKDCFDLVELHCPIGSLEKLVYLNLSDCGGFKYFLFEKSIQSPKVGSLHLIAESVDICPLHSDSNLQKFQFSCFYEEPIPSSYGNLGKLISVGLCTCTNLESFSESICNLQSLRKFTLEGSISEVPKDLDRLESLEELSLLSEKIQHLPNSICMLKHLKRLKLKSCWLIEKLPKDLGRLECLEDLYLTDCILLRDIPKSICELKHLKYFHLPYCMLVEKLPEELGRLECLKELNIEGAGITHLPQSIFGLEGLRIIGSRWRLQSYGFTSMYPVSPNSSYMVYCYIEQCKT